MNVVLLGSGTSSGVPVIGCRCPVCTSTNPKNRRTRSSVLIQDEEVSLLIDTTTDFRYQAIREGIDHIDAVFYTHTHADHLHGIDDLRQLSHRAPIPVYAGPTDLSEIEKRFPYIFRDSLYPESKPRISPIPFSDLPVQVGTIGVLPIPIFHGSLPIYGFRIGGFAYLTDCSSIPDESYELLEGVEVLIVDALRHKPHPTHFTVSEAVEAGQRIGARETYLTHICHDLEHAALERELPGGTFPAYDGLTLRVDE